MRQLLLIYFYSSRNSEDNSPLFYCLLSMATHCTPQPVQNVMFCTTVSGVPHILYHKNTTCSVPQTTTKHHMFCTTKYHMWCTTNYHQTPHVLYHKIPYVVYIPQTTIKHHMFCTTKYHENMKCTEVQTLCVRRGWTQLCCSLWTR